MSIGEKIGDAETLYFSDFKYCPLFWMFCSRQSNNLTKFMKGI